MLREKCMKVLYDVFNLCKLVNHLFRLKFPRCINIYMYIGKNWGILWKNSFSFKSDKINELKRVKKLYLDEIYIIIFFVNVKISDSIIFSDGQAIFSYFMIVLNTTHKKNNLFYFTFEDWLSQNSHSFPCN